MNLSRLPDRIEIIGGNPLEGCIEVNGPKNGVTKDMASQLMSVGECVIENVPDIEDVDTFADHMRAFGAKVYHDLEARELHIDSKDDLVLSRDELLKSAWKDRIALLTAGISLAKFGRGYLIEPGGCDDIGSRDISGHYGLFKAFGLDVTRDENGTIEIKDRSPSNLILNDDLSVSRLSSDHTTDITLRDRYVGVTEQYLFTAPYISNRTRLINGSRAPEVVNLANNLIKRGANIDFDDSGNYSTDTVFYIESGSQRHYADRIEASSWALKALVTGGDITIANIDPRDYVNFFDFYESIGGGYEFIGGKFNEDGSISVGKDGELTEAPSIRFFQAEEIMPGKADSNFFPDGLETDIIQEATIALITSKRKGISEIHERIFEDRLNFLKNLGLVGNGVEFVDCTERDCRLYNIGSNHVARINHPVDLKFIDQMEATNLRAATAMIGLSATLPWRTKIYGAGFANRGHARMPEKMDALGLKWKPV